MGKNARVHLRQIAVANHCTVDWNKMRGEAATRFCGSCKSNVYNLSEMSEAEVEGLLARGDELCVRYYYRADGTIVTSACATDATRRAPTALAAGVASALVYSTAFVGISAAVGGSADTTASAAQDDGNLKVAMGLRLTIKKSPLLPPEERERRRLERRQRLLQERDQDVSDAMPNLAPSMPATATVRPASSEASAAMPVIALGGAAALIGLVMILGTASWPLAGLATLIAGLTALARRHRG